MRGGKRRRSPPPAGRRGEDRRLGANGPGANFRDRRPRSISPEPRYRRSPPPFNKRYRREEEPYDRYGRGPDAYDRRGGYGRERFDEDPYGPPPPYGRRFPSPPHAKREPLAYKEFMLRLADDVTPEDAQREYQRYLAEYWGSQTRAEFQAKHKEPWMRRKYDLREQLRALEERNAAARAAAADFARALASGGLDPAAPGFHQGEGSAAAAPASAACEGGGEPNGAANPKDEGAGEAEEKADPPARDVKAGSKDTRASAPEVCWKAERVEADLALAKQLMAKVDAEKGIEGNPVEAHAAAAEPQDAPAAEGAEGQEEAAKEPLKKGYEDIVALLDLHLTYLWRVHGVDYYAGAELADPDAYAARPLDGGRLLRGPRPEEGEQAAEGAESKELKALEEVVDTIWKQRLEGGDPFEADLGKERVHVQLEEWVEDQVTRLEENKWGCKLSQKLFVGKEYVLKHIRLKHAQTMEAKREEIYDKIYYENFERAKKAEEARAREEAQRAQQAAWGGGPGGPPGWGGGPPPPGWEGAGWEGGGGAEGFAGEGFAGGPPGWAGGVAGVPFPPNRVGSGFGDGVVPGPLPVGAPAIGPGQMLVLAPGAGPLGPFISVAIPEGGPVPMAGPPVGPRGPPGGGMRGRGPPRGRGRGGFGPPGGFGGPMMGGGRRGGYYDLDAPENQRSVLDYGDL